MLLRPGAARGPRAGGTREPLQFGAEIYGHAGLEADLEVQDLALGCLSAGLDDLTLDLADARIVRALLAGVAPDAPRRDVGSAGGDRDAGRPERAAPASTRLRGALLALPALRWRRGPSSAAAKLLPAPAGAPAALADLATLARHAPASALTEVQCRLRPRRRGRLRHYYSVRASRSTPGAGDSIARGGRYDEVGAIFGRNRPASASSLDLDSPSVGGGARRPPAVRAPVVGRRRAARGPRRLREQGESRGCVLPGHEHEGEEFECDRELVAVGGQWAVRA